MKASRTATFGTDKGSVVVDYEYDDQHDTFTVVFSGSLLRDAALDADLLASVLSKLPSFESEAAS